jgi:tetratricopeptide (TPR) repeat protein
VGRHDDAIAQAELARELDPLSLIVNTWLGVHYYFARQPDLAFEQYRRTAELDPNFVPLLWHLGWLYEAEGLHAEALEAYEKAVSLSDESPLYIAALAQALALTGDTEQAHERLDELMELSQRRHVPAYQIAMIHFRLGQTDEAFAWFEKAYEQRSPRLAFINVEPRLDPLRDDPRFQDLLRRMNFPD